MAGIAKPDIVNLKREGVITLNSSLLRAHNNVMDVSNDISGLFNGQISHSSKYSTVLLSATHGSYIDFTCEEDVRIWCISTKVYSDSIGSSPKDIKIEKWDGSSWILLYTRPTQSNSNWYDLTGIIEAGRYKITPTANYVIMDEWYIERPIVNKTLILSENEYLTNVDSTWVSVSQTLPTLQQFQDSGMDDISILNREIQVASTPQMTNNGALGEGKVFKGTVDLKKYFDLRKIEVK